MDIKQLIEEMTLEEKAGLCSGADSWRTKTVDRLGIPNIMVSDGPHGLRTQKEEGMSLTESIKAVCFPPACLSACSFDRSLLKKMGAAIGREAQAEDVHVVLGPAANIKRSPLCGRNFEYYSEDPYLSSQIAGAFIEGVQSEGVGTSLKHFAANNQEHRRMSVNAEIDERTLREIYLASFESAIKDAKPWTVMCSYNQINGTYSSENRWLLHDLLRKEWGYEGLVMSDWGAVNVRADGVFAELDLEMPSSNGVNDAKIAAAVKAGTLSEEYLDICVENILKLVEKSMDNSRNSDVFNHEADHEIALEVAKESMVLLKNDGILPLNQETKVAFIGEFAEAPRYQGGGSSHINSYHVVGAVEAAEGLPVVYAKGFRTKTDAVDEALETEAIEAAKNAEAAVVFAGLPDAFESEGFDRDHMKMPACQLQLIEKIAEVQPNLVVVLHNGAPVEMPWIDKAKAVLEAYLGGEAAGEAEKAILYGEANPCGKLAESFPIKLSDNPSYLNFPGDNDVVSYREGVYVGYRYYDKKEMEVLFPFGHGLSYTQFAYSDLTLDKTALSEKDTLNVTLKVKNVGDTAGAEVVQIYVKNAESRIARPEKELREFGKVFLQPGEEQELTFALDKRAFAYYDVTEKDWMVPAGVYKIQAAASSRDIRLEAEVTYEPEKESNCKIHINAAIADLAKYPEAKEITDRIYHAFVGEQVKDGDEYEMLVSKAMADNVPLSRGVVFAGKYVTFEELENLVTLLKEKYEK